MVKPRWSETEIREAVRTSTSIRATLRALTQSDSGTARRHLLREIERLGLDTAHFKRPHPWDDDAVREAVRNSTSYAETLRKLGKNGDSAGPFYHLKDKISTLGLSTEHFTGLGWSRGRNCAPQRKPFAEVLVRQDRGRKKTATMQLVRAMFDAGIEHKCSLCGIPPVWQGNPLTLQVDHINGDNRDHRRENVRFLCPNCHTQTPTYGSKKRP